MEIEFDPQKDAKNRARHGVSFAEAQSGLLDPMARVREDRDAEGEARYALLGMSREAVCWSLFILCAATPYA
jgi:uncharacterized DUF497 family protein